jgi:pimeloyl-[acyl-carrier protein] synthase
MTDATETLEFIPRSRRMIEDPHSFYHQLRAADPVHWSDASNCWVLTRYDDVEAVLKDPRFGRGTTYRIVAQNDDELNSVEKLRSHLMPFKDGEEHARIRGAINDIFRQRVARLQPVIQELADGLLDAVADRKQFDLVGEYTYPLSVGVISHLLGIPDEDRDLFKKYSKHFSALLAPRKTQEDIDMANELIVDMGGYFKTLLERNREAGSENLLGDMFAMNAMNDDEMLVMPIFLIFAGHETSMNMITNGLYKLFKQPDQLEKLIQEPEHLSSAVEELLRLTSTNQALYRIAFEDVEIGGKVIKKGEELVAVLSAANRDPSRFPDPDRIDIVRKDGPHLAFGSGIHHCLGSTMGRIEAKIALGTLLERFPKLSQAEEPRWKESYVFRGFERLIVNTR